MVNYWDYTEMHGQQNIIKLITWSLSILIILVHMRYTHSLTHSLTHLLYYSRSTVLLENLTGFQLVKKFLVFYGNRSFITAFASARHLSLSWARSIQSISPNHTFWRSILILSSRLRLGLRSVLFASGFPAKTLYTPLLYPTRATRPAYLILLDFITRTILWGTQCSKINKVMKIS